MLLRVAPTCLAIELGAGLVALVLLVALLPFVVLALPTYFGRAIPIWALAVDVLSVSVPPAGLLGSAAIGMARGVAKRGARSR